MNQETTQDRKHYYLVVGNVVIQEGDNIHAVPQNSMLITDHQNIGVHQLGKAQQALQMTMAKKMGQPINAIDVIIFNLAYLGFMTEEEFHWRPEGMVAQEIQPTAEVIDITQELKDRG